jgi:hypothetical protein
MSERQESFSILGLRLIHRSWTLPVFVSDATARISPPGLCHPRSRPIAILHVPLLHALDDAPAFCERCGGSCLCAEYTRERPDQAFARVGLRQKRYLVFGSAVLPEDVVLQVAGSE